MSNYKAKFRQKDQIEQYEPLVPLSQTQAEYIEALNNDSNQIVVLGPAGTGKTYISSVYAADGLRTDRFEKIVLTRPNVPAGRSLGCFPGTLEDKFSQWTVPFTSIIQTRMTKGSYESAVKLDNIESVPFEVMRGRTFDNALIILDEAQNTSVAEMKMFLTRIGKNSQVIINGDVSQKDIKENSGLQMVIDMMKKYKMDAPLIEFTIEDVVRSGVCAAWVRIFHEEGL